MFNFNVILGGLLITSTLTGLVTEAVKKILAEHNVSYKANTLAGIIATILSVAIGVAYVVLTSTTFTAQVAVYLAVHVVMSWLCAMVGYDKVIQTISQFKTNNE